MTDFARLMNDYFVKYITGQKGSGSNTLKTYRDTFVQLLEFMDEKKHIRADRLEVDSFGYDVINEFLEYLEKEKEGYMEYWDQITKRQKVYNKDNSESEKDTKKK